jgi:hypothetical protein
MPQNIQPVLPNICYHSVVLFSSPKLSAMDIENVKFEIADLRNQLVSHTLYSRIQTKEHLQLFMESHVLAVWDFMSLLKGLQNTLTCTSVPWVPVGNASTRFFINEIVIGEESDVDQNGIRMSHFELYLKAMKECGCDTSKVERFVQLIQGNVTVEKALIEANIASGAREFVTSTFNVIRTGKPHILAAVFTYGREDLIPDMFLSIVKEMQQQFPAQLETFVYYLERHIEVDGDHHSLLAQQMTNELIQNSNEKELEALSYVATALRARVALWDSILMQIEKTVLAY